VHLNWIAPILLQHVHSIPASFRVTLHIHVTKHYFPRQATVTLPPHAVLPNNPAEDESSDWQQYLARAAEPKRRKSRLMSTMSWATWKGEFDEDGQTGPGTRRGTIIPEEIAKLRPAKQLGRSTSDEDKTDLEADIEKEAEDMAVPIFNWTEGYENDTIVSEFGILPSLRTRRLASEAPNIPAVQEDEDAFDIGPRDISPISTNTGRGRVSVEVTSPDPSEGNPGGVSFDNPSPFSTMSRNQRLSTSASRNRVSFEVNSQNPGDQSPRFSFENSSPFSILRGARLSPNIARARASLEVTSPDPADESTRLSFENPSPFSTMRAQRISLDVPSPTPSSPRRFSYSLTLDSPSITPPPAARRISISIEEPDHPRRKSSARSYNSSTAGSRTTAGSRKTTLLAPPPVRSSPLLTVSLNPEISTFTSVQPATPNPTEDIAPDQPVPSSSSLIVPPVPSPREPSPLGSGALTPALTEVGATTFAEDALNRRRQSFGLENIIQWHEGRANLEGVVKEMMEDIGKGGWVSVNACGPKSLLYSARKTVRGLSNVKAVWKGEAGVSFHSETFGW